MIKFLQKIGKALMLPIAALPVAGLMLRLGQPDVFNIPFIANAGDALFANLALIFAIGVAIGLSDDEHGSAGLAGAIGYLVLTNATKALNPDINMAAFGGIIAGIVAGLTYNKFRNVKLPEFLGFFGGRRLVPILTSLFMLLIAFIAGYVWIPIQGFIDSVGAGVVGFGAIGAGLFGFFNRLLIPMGLHHVLNTYFWQTLGEFGGKTGDLNRFFAGDPTAGTYMAGFFPVMMIGLPMVCLAIYFAAKKENRKMVAGMLASIAFTSFLTGITEPIEFLFIFLSPVLLVAHAIITGISMAVTSALGVLHGFSFSAGAIDFFLNLNLGTNPWLIIPIGLVIGVLYFVVFYWAIKKFNIPTPGREDEEEFVPNTSVDKDLETVATKYIEILGGKDNIVTVDNCATRLRLELKDTSIVNDKELKKNGARGTVKVSNTSYQVIVGTNVQFVADAIKAQLK